MVYDASPPPLLHPSHRDSPQKVSENSFKRESRERPLAKACLLEKTWGYYQNYKKNITESQDKRISPELKNGYLFHADSILVR